MASAKEKAASAAFVPPELRTVDVTVPELGGALQVCDMLLSERMAFRRMLARLEKDAAPGVEAGDLMVPQLLALAVRRPDGQRLMTAQQWEIWGATHQGAVLELFNAACKCCGFDGEDAKGN